MEDHKNNSTNVTTVTAHEHMPASVVSLIYVEGFAIVALNLAVLLILVARKKNFPSVYRVQLLCLAVNDMLVGVGDFLLCLVDEPYIKNRYSNCAIVLVFTLVAQSASLYNIFGICIHRFLLLKRCNQNSFTWKHCYTIGCTILAWTLGTSLCFIPFIPYHKTEEYTNINYCSLPTMLKEDLRKGVWIMMMGAYLMPLIFVNIIYAVLFYNMKRLVCRIEPAYAGTSSNGIPNAHRCKPFSSHIETITLYAAELDSKGPSNKGLKSTLHKCPNAYFKRPKCNGLFIKKKRNNDPSGPGNSDANKDPSSVPPRYLLHSTRSIRERSIFNLLGIILLLLNAFTWPGIAGMAMAVVLSSSKVDRNIMIPMITIMSLNSAVNPLLYSMRIPEFRSSLKEIRKSMSEWITCKTSCFNRLTRSQAVSE
ncbi:hypothetical protein ACF0H5_003102 [Mactra antiquata]